jgi:hypothetical protein
MLPFRAEWRVAEDGGVRGRVPAGAEAFGTYRGLPVRIAAGEIPLPPTARATGTVRRFDGAPAARAALLFRPLLDADFAPPLPGRLVHANERGEFDEPELAAVRYAVEAYAPGCAKRIVPEVLPGKGPIEIVLAQGWAIDGFVVDAQGLPVARARIRAVGLPEEAERPVLGATADNLGRFRIAGLGGTHARLRVTAKGFYPTTLELPSTTDRLTVNLQEERK